jgi:hypothetical protein
MTEERKRRIMIMRLIGQTTMTEETKKGNRETRETKKSKEIDKLMMWIQNCQNLG